jgi:hypothetical protein
MNDDQTSFQVETSFVSLAGIFCWTAKKIKVEEENNWLGWMVGSFVQFSLCTCCERLLNSLVRFAHSFVCNLSRLVHKNRTRSPTTLHILYPMFLAVRYNDRYVLFHDRHKFIGAGRFDRQVAKHYFQACLEVKGKCANHLATEAPHI